MGWIELGWGLGWVASGWLVRTRWIENAEEEVAAGARRVYELVCRCRISIHILRRRMERMLLVLS